MTVTAVARQDAVFETWHMTLRLKLGFKSSTYQVLILWVRITFRVGSGGSAFRK